MRQLVLVAALFGAAVGHAAPPPAAPAAAPPAVSTLPEGVGKVRPAELAAKLAPGASDVLVLDVRAPQEYAEGHVPGALNVPHDQLAARLAELKGAENRPVVVYCRSGRRAGLALEVLKQNGFKNLAHLEGDMPGWSAAGKPVEK